MYQPIVYLYAIVWCHNCKVRQHRRQDHQSTSVTATMALLSLLLSIHSTEMRFASFRSGGFITVIVVKKGNWQNAPLCIPQNSAPSDLQSNYDNGVFGNVYLLALDMPLLEIPLPYVPRKGGTTTGPRWWKQASW